MELEKPNPILRYVFFMVGSEDCLYLNVYVPRSNPSEAESLDVIVNLHAGCYMAGSGHQYARPTHLMDRDVIFVTLNNRLSALGKQTTTRIKLVIYQFSFIP